MRPESKRFATRKIKKQNSDAKAKISSLISIHHSTNKFIQLVDMRNIRCENSSNLISHILHSAQHQPISSGKGIRVKGEAMLGGKIFDKWLHLSKVVPWDPGKQVMLNLKLEKKREKKRKISHDEIAGCKRTKRQEEIPGDRHETNPSIWDNQCPSRFAKPFLQKFPQSLQALQYSFQSETE